MSDMICRLCDKPIKRGERWTSIGREFYHWECYEKFCRDNFLKKLKIAKGRLSRIPILEILTKEQVYSMKRHDAIVLTLKEYLERWGFSTKRECWLNSAVTDALLYEAVQPKHKQPPSVRDSRIHEGGYRIDLVAVLGISLRWCVGILIEVSLRDITEDVEKLKLFRNIKWKVVVTENLEGELNNIKIVKIDNFHKFVDHVLDEEIKELSG